MADKHGKLSITSENIFPVIKKWLYSDHDIFYRELISNGCDAITKLQKLDMMGEYGLPEGYRPKIDVDLSPKDKTIKITDNGIGMTGKEVEEYINQIAFSGATDFLNKYKDKASEDQIIGHFGLGFYSAFMVADKVTIDSLSYRKGTKAIHWECNGGTEFDMSDGTKDTVGTTITLYLNEDCLEFVNEYRAREVLEKYCSFMPTEIYLTNTDEGTQYETIDASDKKDTDIIVDTIHTDAKYEDQKQDDGTTKSVEVAPAKDQYKIVKRPVPINDTHPLWSKNPSECTDEEYRDFYRKVFRDYKEPLFWIHLNMDYPFNLKGILYFPKINTEYDSIEGTIKLYNNQVFIADNIKEVIPEYLMLLKGVIDCPDLPLNVSRSALQNDGFVTKISEYITKKVADKLAGLCKTDRENYEKYWDDISPFIKYGCLKDEKFCDRMNDYILFKDINGKYTTLPDLLVPKEKDAAEDSDAAEKDAAKETEPTEDTKQAESDAAENEDSQEDKRDIIFYVTDVDQQGQYINLFKEEGKNAVILDQTIDTSFITQLERRNEDYKFLRIDADLTEDLLEDNDPDALKDTTDQLTEIFRKALGKDKLNVRVAKLKNKDIASMITIGEESRRMQDMLKMYNMYGMNPDMFAGDETLILNADNELVQYIQSHSGDDNASLFAQQLYDLASMANAPLKPEAMKAFIDRSNTIMKKLADS